MDVFNVTSQYVELIDHQKKILQEAKKRQGQRPRDRKSREYTYRKFMSVLRPEGSSDQGLIHSSFIPPAYPPCTSPLTELSIIAIKDLQLEIHHRGTYLLLRSITPPSRMTAIMAIMEDENEDVVMLQLYQQEDQSKRAASNVVNVGTILLVKEPYFKVMGDGEYGLRVDHLSDVIHIKKDVARIPRSWQTQIIPSIHSAESLKTKGNLFMEKKRYWEAITEYSDALGYPATADLIDIIKRNRSLAYLKTNQFDAALTDSGFPNLNPNPAEKTLFRAADALYHLERYSDCCQLLELLCSNFPQNSQASVALDRAQSRVREQKTGLYNFKELQAKAKKLRPPHLDHATYLGPIEIRQTESKGRGLFVTKAVKAGDLLLCEKAFSHAHAYEDRDDANNGNSSKISLVINPETNQGFKGTQADLLKLIVQKIYHNPSVAPPFVTLYHGTYEGVSTSAVDEKPIVDTFLVERIISHNAFGCPVSSLNCRIKECNQPPPTYKKANDEEGHHSCGIWTHASYVNHSCTSNARRAFIGNMMIVRATRDMDAGTEITFWYKSPSNISEKTLDETHKNWGFVCACAICLDTRATSAVIVRKRKKLNDDLKRAFNMNSSDPARQIETEKIERLLDALNQTYTKPTEDVPRLLVWDPQLLLTRIYKSQNKASKTIESAVKVLTSLGFVVHGAADSSRTLFTIVRWGLLVDHLVETLLHIRTAFAAMKAMKDSARADEYARTIYKILVGEGESFDATYG